MTMIPVQSVKDQRFNRPRSVHTVQTMAASIMTHGQLQPIRAVRITTDDAQPVYRVIEGGTRLAAFRYLGKDFIDAVIVEEDITATTELIQSFTANAQRSDFTPLEKAELIQMLMRENNWSPAKVARQLGISPAEVCKLLAIGKDLIDPLKVMVADLTLGASTAYLLCRLPAEVQAELVEKAAGMTRDTAERLVAKYGTKNRKPKPVMKTVKSGCVTVTYCDTVSRAEFREAIARIEAADKQAERNGKQPADLGFFMKQ